MSNRPTPRKSSLSGSPVTPPALAQTPQERPAAAAAPIAPPAVAEHPKGAQSAAGKASKPARTPKISIYQHPEDSGRTRAAVLALQRFESATTLSKFANDAIMEKVARVEAQYNGGEPFEPIGTGVMTVGRRMGE